MLWSFSLTSSFYSSGAYFLFDQKKANQTIALKVSKTLGLLIDQVNLISIQFTLSSEFTKLNSHR